MRVDIERFGINGEGIGIIPEGDNAGKIIFVKNALPTETVNVEVIKDTKTFCMGQVSECLKMAKFRKTPKCRYFNDCGGCNLQHIDNEHQVKFKTENVKNTIKKIANIDVEINDYVSDREFNYRNKMVFPIGSKDGKATLGMFKGESHEVIEIDECLLADKEINEILVIVREYLNENFKGYSFKEKKGVVKYIVIRVHEGNFLITVVATKKITLDNFYKVLCKRLKNVGLSLIISDSDDEILSGDYYQIDGLKYLEFNEFSIKYKIDNRGFLQVNDKIKSKLYAKVLENINVNDVVLDGYSGAGLLSSIISKKCKKVIGVEINHSACESARKLIIDNGITNLEYFEGDIKKYIDKCVNDDVNVVVLDPPRSGCNIEILERIVNAKNAKKIIYISCNPATLARDLGVLNIAFDIKHISLWDMFPQTKHVETLVVLERKD